MNYPVVGLRSPGAAERPARGGVTRLSTKCRRQALRQRAAPRVRLARGSSKARAAQGRTFSAPSAPPPASVKCVLRRRPADQRGGSRRGAASTHLVDPLGELATWLRRAQDVAAPSSRPSRSPRDPSTRRREHPRVFCPAPTAPGAPEQQTAQQVLAPSSSPGPYTRLGNTVFTRRPRFAQPWIACSPACLVAL